MRALILLFLCLCLNVPYGRAQQSLFDQAELQIAYFGELLAHPGAKIGLSVPLLKWQKDKERHRKRRGTFTVSKQKQLRLGSNIAFYHQVRNHNGYLWNAELSYRRIKTRSFKPDRQAYFEASIALGYFYYQLLGTTFRPDGDSFEEINGNGHAFSPAFSLTWGRNIRWIKSVDVHYFIRPTVFFEIPFSSSFLTHLALEVGVAMPLSFSKTPQN